MTFSVSGAPLRLGVVFLTVGVLKATQLHVKIMSKHLELAIPLGRNMLILVFMLANYTIYSYTLTLYFEYRLYMRHSKSTPQGHTASACRLKAQVEEAARTGALHLRQTMINTANVTIKCWYLWIVSY